MIERTEIFDHQTYEEMRPAFRREVMAAKARRRIHVGSCFTFLFENPLTMRYQVQEMMRTEKIVGEREIQHEVDTYNGLLGGRGELGCTLLIEIEDEGERDRRLRDWLTLPEHLYALLPNGAKARPTFDEHQRGADRLSSVQYLKFPVGEEAPVAVGVDHPAVSGETRLTDDQRAALREDLRSNR